MGALGVPSGPATRAVALAIVLLATAAVLAGAVAAASGDSGSRSVVSYGPDLAVSAGDVTLSKPVLLADVPFNLTVKIYNLGDVDATRVTVDFLVDGVPAGATGLDLVPRGSYATVSYNFTLSQGVHQLSIVVDAADIIDEEREDNNAATVSLTIHGLPDIAIGSDGVVLSDPHPMEGQVVTVDVLVRNLGETQATLVVVQFWDGEVGMGALIANRTTSIPSGGSVHVSAPWDTHSLGGTHYLTVAATTVLPGEQDPSNNAANITVLIFTQWDMVVDSVSGDVRIDQQWTQDGFVTIRKGHTLTVTGVELTFLQDYPYQFALFVEDGATLSIESAKVSSEQPLLVVLEGGAHLRMAEGSVLQATVDLRGQATLDIQNSYQAGGISGGAASATLHNVTLEGVMGLRGCRLTADSVEFSSTDPLALDGGSAVLRDCMFTGGADTSLALTGGARVELRNVTCGNVSTDDASKALVYRRVDILVVDESTLVIPGASIKIVHFINETEVVASVGGSDGWAQVEVVSDVIEAGQSHFIGNYKVLAHFSSVSSSAPLLLDPFPNMTERSNRPSMTVVLPPIEPRDLVSSTQGDMVLEAADAPLGLVADFIEDGNIVVRGTLTVSAPAKLSVLQDRNHQFYVLVEGSGRLFLDGGTLTSGHPINIYLYDNAQLVLGPGSTIAVNAIVAQDNATVTATNATIKARLLLRGGAVVLTGGCNVESDRIVIEAPSLKVSGGIIGAKSVSTSAPFTSLQDVSIFADEFEMSSTLANVTGSAISVPVFRVHATILTLSGSRLTTEEPAHLNVSTFYADTSVLSKPMDELPDSAKVYLYDAAIPRPFSLSNSTVYVYWYLMVDVQDALGNRIGGAAIDVSFTRNGTGAAYGETNDNGQVRIPLLGSIVDANGERFVGNYRVIVSNPKDTAEKITSYVNLDSGKTLQVSFPESLLPPTGVEVEAFMANTTVVAGTNFTVRGSVVATYPVGRRPLDEGIVVIKLINNTAPIWQNSTTLDADGFYSIVVPAPERVGAYTIEVEVQGTGAFAGVDGRAHVIAIEVVEPAPTRIVVVLEVEKVDPFVLGNQVVIRGTIRYNDAQGRPVPGARVLCKDDPTHQTMQQGADGVGAFEFTYDSPPYVGQWNYAISAKDEGLKLESASINFVVFAVAGPKTQAGGINGLLIGVIIAVVIAVLVVGGVLAQMLFSSKGKMVECGGCGTLVPENAVVCPKCGTEFETDVAKCSECGSWIKSQAIECPYCGTKFKDLAAGAEDEDEEKEEGKGDAGGEGGAPAEPVMAEVPAVEGLATPPERTTVPEGAVPDAAALADAAKRAPEGIAGGAVASQKQVVQRRAVATPSTPEERATRSEPADSRPRVRKVSKPPQQNGNGGGEGEGGH